ncbi:hypothetical protein BJY52DRAFT_473345 [Lactarius psammicola]|nr:hypothetical protein BJY52DRAFT_473345 [Lactarius psammicola]
MDKVAESHLTFAHFAQSCALRGMTNHAGVENVGRIREAAWQPGARTRQKTRQSGGRRWLDHPSGRIPGRSTFSGGEGGSSDRNRRLLFGQCQISTESSEARCFDYLKLLIRIRYPQAAVPLQPVPQLHEGVRLQYQVLFILSSIQIFLFHGTTVHFYISHPVTGDRRKWVLKVVLSSCTCKIKVQSISQLSVTVLKQVQTTRDIHQQGRVVWSKKKKVESQCQWEMSTCQRLHNGFLRPECR